jgi:hypothetical protein
LSDDLSVCSNYRLHKVRCLIEAFQLGSFIELVRSTCKIADDADDQIVSTEPICHLSERRSFHFKCKSLMLAEEAIPCRPTKNEDITRNNPPKMDLYRLLCSPIAKFSGHVACDPLN